MLNVQVGEGQVDGHMCFFVLCLSSGFIDIGVHNSRFRVSQVRVGNEGMHCRAPGDSGIQHFVIYP